MPYSALILKQNSVQYEYKLKRYQIYMIVYNSSEIYRPGARSARTESTATSTPVLSRDLTSSEPSIPPAVSSP